MGVPVAVNPRNLNFGVVAPNSTGPAAVVQRQYEIPGAPNFDGGLVVEKAPADAKVSLRLTGDDRGCFEIKALNVYERHAVPASPATVLDPVVSSDGSAPVAVKAGQLVYVGVAYHTPDQGGEVFAVLHLRGSSWNATRVMLSFQLPPQVDTSLRTVTPVALPQGERVNILVTANARTGAETDVVYALASGPQPQGVSVPALVLHLPQAPSVAYGYLLLDVAADAPLGHSDLVVEQRVGVGVQPTRISVPVNVVAQDPARWWFVGPLNYYPGDFMSGRATAVAFDPQRPDVFYLGGDGGGVFRTEDHGLNWHPLTDWWTFEPMTVTTIAVDPEVPDTVYAGTTAGLMRTLDGGRTWSAIGEEFRGAPISKVIIDSPDYVWATTSPGGVWRSSDYIYSPDHVSATTSPGGVWRSSDYGDSWQPMPPLDSNARWTDIARAAGARLRYYAVAAGDPQLWRTDNGGESWTRLHVTSATERPTAAGQSGGPLLLAPPQYERPLLACSPTDPDVVYLFCPLPQTKPGDPQGSVYKSSDAGATWTNISAGWHTYGDMHSVCCACSTEGDPATGSDHDILYVGKAELHRYAQGEWQKIEDLHPDQQALAISPADSSLVMIGHDGGVCLYDDAEKMIRTMNAQLGGLTQLYSVGYSDGKELRIIAGAQDVGTAYTRVTESPRQPADWPQVEWRQSIDGDGGSSAISPANPDIQFGTLQIATHPGLYRTADGWQQHKTLIFNFDDHSGEPHAWATPLVFDPGDPRILYFATNYLYRWLDPYPADVDESRPDQYWARLTGALTSNGPVNTIAAGKGPRHDTYVYTGANDGQLWMSANSGQNWRRIDTGLPGDPINSIAVHPDDPTDILVATGNQVYWCPDTSLSASSRTMIGRWSRRLVWENVSARPPSRFIALVGGAGSRAALPDRRMISVVRDPLNPGLRWWVGSDEAVFHTEDGGVNWYNFPLGLPPIKIQHLTLLAKSRYLYAETVGRGIWRAKI